MRTLDTSSQRICPTGDAACRLTASRTVERITPKVDAIWKREAFTSKAAASALGRCLAALLLFLVATVALAQPVPDELPKLSLAALPSADGQPDRVAVKWSGDAADRYWIGKRLADGGVTPLTAPLAIGAGMQLAELPRGVALHEAVVGIEAADGRLLARQQAAGTDPAGYGWQPLFYGPGLDGAVFAAVVWDDGNGPALYVGGDFVTAGRHVVNNIARWDGSEWSPLRGASGTGTNYEVRALAVYNGVLAVGGEFTQAGGVTVNYIARWNGNDWSTFSGPSGVGMSGGSVYALSEFNGDLIAGGRFTSAGGVTVNRVARWDTASAVWTQMNGPSGTGVNDYVYALTVHAGALYAGGSFATAGGMTVNRIARWNGSQWSALTGSSGTGLSGSNAYAYALASYGGSLIVGGSFSTAGGVSGANNIARWNGSEWFSLQFAGTGSGNSVRALGVYAGNLYVVGDFLSAGGVAVNRIARWNGSTWSALTGAQGTGIGSLSPDSSYPYAALTEFAGHLYVGASFDTAGGSKANHLARWTGSNWALVAEANGGTGLDGAVKAATVYQGDLVVGGDFTYAGALKVNHVARWNGSAWSALGPSATPGMSIVTGTPAVLALTVHDDDLIAAGSFTGAGAATAVNIARWNGSAWFPLQSSGGNGTSGTVRALQVHQGNLYAGGDFVSAGGVTVNRVARWDGVNWTALDGPSGTGVNNAVYALASFEDTLVAGGTFTSAGGVSMNRIARWNGEQWDAMGSVGSTIYAMTVQDGDLFNANASTSSTRVYRWTGTAWAAFSGGPDGTRVLMPHDDDLVVAGVPYQSSPNIYRSNGSDLTELGGPFTNGIRRSTTAPSSNASVYALANYNGLLIAGSEGRDSGGIANWRLAAWRAEPASAAFAPLDPVPANQSTPITVVVTGEASLPIPGRIRVLTDNGQSCTSTAGVAISATAAQYTCSITFNRYGERILAAAFSQSSVHRNVSTELLTLTVEPLPAQITISSLTQTYNGTPRSVSVSTSPSLGTQYRIVTYNGQTQAPTDAGSYDVSVVIEHPIYAGSATATLTINPANQSITFSLPSTRAIDAEPLVLTAGGGASGNPVRFAVDTPTVCALGGDAGNVLTLLKGGVCTVRATQEGNNNYNPAAPVIRNMTVQQSDVIFKNGFDP